jgi:hypothetical protein
MPQQLLDADFAETADGALQQRDNGKPTELLSTVVSQ